MYSGENRDFEREMNSRSPRGKEKVATEKTTNFGYGTYIPEGTERQHLNSKEVMAKEVNILLRITVDFICLLIVGLPILILHLAGKPYKRGINCDDESIRYPFRDSTITNTTLYCVGIMVPAFVIIATESTRYYFRSRTEPAIRRVILRFNVHPLLWELYIKLGVFAFGACLSQMTTDIAKYTIGRLRPHFWDVCKPDYVCASDDHSYITDFECTSGKTTLIREARLSFLSGHSSFSAFTMVYIVLYMQSRMRLRGFKLVRPFLQALALYAAWYTALSRISDYKHHWSDVLAGSLQGTVVALLVVFFISDLFLKKKPESAISSYIKPPAEFSSYSPADRHKSDLEQCS